MDWQQYLLQNAAKVLLVRERMDLSDPVDRDTYMFRKAICMACPERDPDKNRCKVCTCFLDVKWESKVNINTKTKKREITHCPNGFWGDAHLLNN